MLQTSSLRPRRAVPLTLVLVLLGVAGCGDGDGTGPGSLRFGQIGQAEVELTVPLRLGEGMLEQRVQWTSAGTWVLEEEISYEGVVGDRTVSTSTQNPEVLAGLYAQWIAQVNDVPSLALFVPELDPALEPECGVTRTRIRLRIRDEARREEIAWTRCADGSLSTLVPQDAGPDPAAGRLVTAAALARDYVLGEGFLSTYHGSAPFATLARGEGSFAELPRSQVIASDSAWTAFWHEHTGTTGAPPPVDFEEESVIVGAVGVRQEAGDSVEVRRVIPVDQGTFVELVERIPGDFCSPAARTQTPFHIVVAPAVRQPVQFSEVRVERVPCGL